MKIAFGLMAAALALSGCNPPDQLRAEAPPSPCQSAAALAINPYVPPEARCASSALAWQRVDRH